MSSAHHATPLGGVGGVETRRKTNELVVRIVLGICLAATAVAVIWAGGYFFAGFVALAAIAAAREWHRMVGTPRYGREWLATSGSIAAALTAVVMSTSIFSPAAFLCAGAFFAAGLSTSRGTPNFWSGLGPLYIGIPACAIVALRVHSAQAEWVVLGMFLIIWSADTGALAAGRIFGGPKLIPALSPGKTWSGLIGGLVLPAFVAAGYAAAFGGSAWRGFALGLVLAGAGHGGDLFESWIKRRVGRKDSGESIPGHGGVLDRLDSTLFVAPLAAILIFLFGVSKLLGVHA